MLYTFLCISQMLDFTLQGMEKFVSQQNYLQILTYTDSVKVQILPPS